MFNNLNTKPIWFDKLNYLKYGWLLKLFMVVVLTAILISFFLLLDFELSPNGILVFKDRINKIFSFKNSISDYPNTSLWTLSYEYLFISIKDAIVGTAIGFLIALITSFFQNNNLIKNRWLTSSFKIIIPILRALPVIFFIYIFSYTFLKDLGLILIYMWFTWLWSHKYLSEYYQNINYSIFEKLKLQGNGVFIAYIKGVWFQMSNKIISLFLFSFESNMRWSSILGVFGLPGIGELIYKASNNEYESMGIPILTLMVFMIFLEMMIYLINKFLLTKKTVKTPDSVRGFINRKDYYLIAKIILFASFFSLLIYSLFSINWSESIYLQNSILETLFNPDWNVFNEINNFNIFYELFYLFGQTIIIMFFSFVVSMLLIYSSSYKIFGNIGYIGILINTILRAIPIIAIIFIFNPLFSNPSSAICLILGFETGLVISKTMLSSVNDISNEKLMYFKMIGYSKNKIFIKYTLYKILNDYLNIFLFSWESQFRDLITFGKYGSSIIGMYIDIYFNGSKKEFNKMASFIWVSFAINILVILIIFITKETFINKRKLFSEIKEIFNDKCNIWNTANSVR